MLKEVVINEDVNEFKGLSANNGMINEPMLGDFDIASLKSSAAKASVLLKSLSHPDRLLLLCQLVEGEACVRDLEISTGIKQPSLSQQLGVLRDNELVATRREGRQIFYSLNSEDAQAVLQVLYTRFCQ